MKHLLKILILAVLVLTGAYTAAWMRSSDPVVGPP